MVRTKWLVLFVLSMFTVSSGSAVIFSMIPVSETHYVAKAFSETTYPNSNIASLWVRHNGSDIGFPYGGANVNPSVGMNYFGTNVLQLTYDYNWTDIANPALFPANCTIYIQMYYDAGFATTIADQASNDSRIRGAFIDDFQVGLQSPGNMSAIYVNLHHEDGNLTYGPLKLGLIVYETNYFHQTPYTWANIYPYFDIIQFWYYPFNYGLLYQGLAGYEDDFMAFRDILDFTPTISQKEYWLGIYLHFYNVGAYPENFTNEQMSIGGKLIKLGYATRYTILENFWIQHNLPTAKIVKDFINNELQKNYLSVWYWGSGTIASFSNNQVLLYPLVNDIKYQYSYHTYLPYYDFFSKNLQNFNVITTVNSNYMVWNLRTGNHQFPDYDVYTETATYVLEPNQKYRIMYFQLTDYNINSNMTITTSTSWTNRLVTINANITLNATLIITHSIIRFGNDNYKNSMTNFTYPRFGLTMSPIDASKLFVYESIIEPVNRVYPYHLTRPYALAGWDSTFFIENSVIACYSHIFYPCGIVGIYSSTFFQVQPNGATYNALLWLEAPSYLTAITIYDSLFWNYDTAGTIGIFLMPSTLQYNNHLSFRDNTIVGGNWGLWVDMHYSYDYLTIENHTSYSASSSDLFITFRYDRNPASVQTVSVTTYNIFKWSVKAYPYGGIFIMKWVYLPNGIYDFSTDNTTISYGVTTTSLEVGYENPWWAYRNNFSLTLLSSNIDTEQTIDNLVWLLFIFIAPIAMAQVIPKMGFYFGMILMLLITSFQDMSFIPYMFLGILVIAITIFKSR